MSPESKSSARQDKTRSRTIPHYPVGCSAVSGWRGVTVGVTRFNRFNRFN
jgi:hypothetical protein